MLGAGLFGLYLQIMVDTGDIAREEVSKGVEDQHSAVGVLYGPRARWVYCESTCRTRS